MSTFVKRALITGITGQDGSYLAELLPTGMRRSRTASRDDVSILHERWRNSDGAQKRLSTMVCRKLSLGTQIVCAILRVQRLDELSE